MRPIDADALMEQPVWFCGGWVGDSYAEGYMDALDKVEETIKSAPTIDAEPKWVSCEERLPEKEQLVLCQSRSGIINVLRLKSNELWESQYPHVNYRFSFVTAWMSFPEPYKGRSK